MKSEQQLSLLLAGFAPFVKHETAHEMLSGPQTRRIINKGEVRRTREAGLGLDGVARLRVAGTTMLVRPRLRSPSHPIPIPNRFVPISIPDERHSPIDRQNSHSSLTGPSRACRRAGPAWASRSPWERCRVVSRQRGALPRTLNEEKGEDLQFLASFGIICATGQEAHGSTEAVFCICTYGLRWIRIWGVARVAGRAVAILNQSGVLAGKLSELVQRPVTLLDAVRVRQASRSVRRLGVSQHPISALRAVGCTDPTGCGPSRVRGHPHV